MGLFDSHCHLHFSQYDDDRDAVVSRTVEAGMRCCLVGVSLEDSERAIALAKTQAQFVASVGVHPTDTDEPFDEGRFRELLRDPKAAAVGEIGLDYFRNPVKEVQRELFLRQLAIAKELDKPVIIHCRDAYDDLLAIMENEGRGVRFVMHTFASDIATAEKVLALGGLLGFSGIVTFDKTGEQEKVVAAVPLEKTLIETDAPYLTPVPHRGKRNEPLYVEEVAKKVALIKNLPLETITAQTIKNASTFFGK